MVYTNPGAISNSGSSYFTNQKSKIDKLNLNILENFNITNDYDSLYVPAIFEIGKKKNEIIDTQNDFKNILEQQKTNSKYMRMEHQEFYKE